MYPDALLITVGVIGVSLVVSWYARRWTSTKLEFYLAARTVGVFTNASAVCGDYFSAASFLGVAGAVYAYGLDGVWFGVGFAGGFVPLLLFVAAPLRRFGEYTLPDFFEARFRSASARLSAVGLVQLIVLFYLAPQMVGAGTVWELLVGAGFAGLDPYATGLVVTTLVMILYTTIGGMRGMTWNQALQFWMMVLAIATVLAFAWARGFRYTAALADLSRSPIVAPERWRVLELLRPDTSGTRPLDRARAVTTEAYWRSQVLPKLGDLDAEVLVPMPQPSHLFPGHPGIFNRPGQLYALADQVSLLITLLLGTAGLPHILIRFSTNPTGTLARRSTVWVVFLTSLFYLLASTAGIAGRALTPALARARPASGGFQTVDGWLVQPDLALPFLAFQLGGNALLGLVAAGAFAAMFSTIGGLLLASAASWGHDVFERWLRPEAPERVRVAVARASVVFMALVAFATGLVLPRVALVRAFPALIAQMVGWAFAISASGMVPALVLSIWWRGTTLRGVLAGMLAGGGGAAALLIARLAAVVSQQPARLAPPELAGLTFPTILTAPLAVVTIVGVSLLDRRNRPPHLDEVWSRLHGTAEERRARSARIL